VVDLSEVEVLPCLIQLSREEEKRLMRRRYCEVKGSIKIAKGCGSVWFTGETFLSEMMV